MKRACHSSREINDTLEKTSMTVSSSQTTVQLRH